MLQRSNSLFVQLARAGAVFYSDRLAGCGMPQT
jgi:hypothetical protein